MSSPLEGTVALVTGASSGIGEAAVNAVQRTVRELGRLDTVINNAGAMLLGPIEGAAIEEWDRMVPHLLRAAEGPPRWMAINELLVRPTEQQG